MNQSGAIPAKPSQKEQAPGAERGGGGERQRRSADLGTPARDSSTLPHSYQNADAITFLNPNSSFLFWKL